MKVVDLVMRALQLIMRLGTHHALSCSSEAPTSGRPPRVSGRPLTDSCTGLGLWCLPSEPTITTGGHAGQEKTLVLPIQRHPLSHSAGYPPPLGREATSAQFVHITIEGLTRSDMRAA